MIFSSMTDQIMMRQLQSPMVILTGLVVLKHDVCSAVFVSNSQAGLLPTSLNSNQRLHYHLRRLNSWLHVTLDGWHSSYAASCGTSASPRKPQQLHTKIMTAQNSAQNTLIHDSEKSPHLRTGPLSPPTPHGSRNSTLPLALLTLKTRPN